MALGFVDRISAVYVVKRHTEYQCFNLRLFWSEIYKKKFHVYTETEDSSDHI
jgi:hypothetical protein